LGKGEGENVPLKRKGYFRHCPHLLRIPKVIGDGLAVLVYVFVLFLMFWHFA
jgi:hypothetical protein